MKIFTFHLTHLLVIKQCFHFSFTELVGYTAKFVWGLSCPLWEAALDHHYHHNQHHPQHRTGQRMPLSHLEESVVDMMACSWERRFGGGEEVTLKMLADMEDHFLERYMPEDRQIVKKILKKIQNYEPNSESN